MLLPSIRMRRAWGSLLLDKRGAVEAIVREALHSCAINVFDATHGGHGWCVCWS